jgi:hypothetical protein
MIIRIARLLAAEYHATRTALVQPRAVVAENGKAEELVRVRQLVASLLPAGVVAGNARHQGCALGGALALGPSVCTPLRPALGAEVRHHRPVPGPSVREYDVGDEATRVRGVSSRPGGGRVLWRGQGIGHRRQRDQRAVGWQGHSPSRVQMQARGVPDCFELLE